MKSFFKVLAFFFYMIGAFFKGFKLDYLKKNSSKEKYEEYLNKSVLNWAKFTVKIVGLDLDVIGIENLPKETCVFVSNHQSNLDIPCILVATNRTMGFIAKKELEKAPLIVKWAKAIHCVFIDRENIRESLKSILQGVDILKEGYSMLIFPEGTRSKTGNVAEFKKGSMKLATKSDVQVVPISVSGTRNAWEANKGKLNFKNSKVKIIIGKSINVKELEKEQKNDLHNIVREEILNNLKKYS